MSVVGSILLANHPRRQPWHTRTADTAVALLNPEPRTLLRMPTEATDRIDDASLVYLGQWNHLVSTTNWEKGRIIAQWRATLEEQQLPIAEFSDEAWARLVGGVTGQHV